MSRPRDQRLGYIDALRGAAALCVCVYHGFGSLTEHASGGSLVRGLAIGRWIDLGRYGVVLFFLISGFVIPFSLRGERSLERFAITRIFRLYPPFWLSVGVTVAVLFLMSGMHFTIAQVMANLTMMPSLLGQPYLSGVYWTLFIEILFYCACSVLYACGLLRKPLAIFLVGLACAAIPPASFIMRYIGIPVPVLLITGYISYLFLGYLLRMAILREQPHASIPAVILTFIILAITPMLTVVTISTRLGVFVGTALALATFLFVNRRPFAPSPWFSWLGTISYSIYLFHTPMRRLAEVVLPPVGIAASVGFFVLFLCTTIGLSALVYYGLEHPCILLGKRLVRARKETLAMDVAP